jgi:hypothetical protein
MIADATHRDPRLATAGRARADARSLARVKRAALRRSAKRIRRSVAGLALALFIAAFAGIYVQLASGHDPVLAVSAQRRTAAKVVAGASAADTAGVTATATRSSGSARAESSSTASGTGSGQVSGTSSSSPTAVTTSQS